MNIENYNPLVSIVVVAYNSSKYILETLESAKAQTYKNIELIITDDASTDNTIKICEDWLSKNKASFKRTKIVTVEKNTGISPNCNRGLSEVEGEWVKFIAGDDILIERCIELNLNFTKNSNDSFFFSMMECLVKNPKIEKEYEIGYKLFNNERNQLNILLKGNFLLAPTAFLKTETLKDLGGFNEDYPMLEDYPLWLKAVKNNHRIIYNNVKTIIYRIHENSTSSNLESNEYVSLFYSNFKYQKSYFKHLEKEIIKDSFLNFKLFTAYIHFISLIQFKIAQHYNNKKTNLSVTLFNLIALFSPYTYYAFFKKIIGGD